VAIDFKLPELGENIAAGDVLQVLVKAGDFLVKNQAVLELETDKATIEVPSSVAGQVKDVKVKKGDKIKVGQAILSYDEAAGADGAAAAPGKPADKDDKDKDKKEAGPTAADRAEAPADAATERPAPVDVAPARDRKVVDIGRGARPVAPPEVRDTPVAPAAPSVRRMARELGVDIDQVPGTGPDGRISIDDVKEHARRIVTGVGAGRAPAHTGEPLPDFSRWGEIDRQPMRAVRRKTAEHLAAAWAAIPHVTQHDLVDITVLEDLRKRYAKKAEALGGGLTVTAIAVKVVAAALKIFPQLNSSIDLAADEIIYKKYVHIGIAVDTDRGLLVPVIRNADTKNILQLSVEIAQLSEKARTRKISLDEMQGGTFSISNLGGIGGTAFTPLVNLPEVAILGISRARMEPAYVKETGQFVPRLMLPLSLSYDHRVVDGADGIRFLRWVAEALEQPFLLALEG
jgi:pyruvate dehydrogenase E2 component (dihydrolipoamide acetyltransferase)